MLRQVCHHICITHIQRQFVSFSMQGYWTITDSNWARGREKLFSRNRVREVTLRSWTQAHAKHHSLSLCLCASLSPNPPADWPELGLLVWAGSLPHYHSALIWAACLHAARLNTPAAPCQRRSGSHCHPWERQLEVVCTWMGTSQLGRGERKGHHGSCSGHMGRIH